MRDSNHELVLIGGIVLTVVLALALLIIVPREQEKRRIEQEYQQGIEYARQGDYWAAKKLFSDKWNYKNSEALYYYCEARTGDEDGKSITTVEFYFVLGHINDNYNGDLAEEVLEYKKDVDRRKKEYDDWWNGLSKEERKRIDDEYLVKSGYYDKKKSRGKPAEAGRLPFVGMREWDIDNTVLGKHTKKDYNFNTTPIKTTYTWRDSNNKPLAIVDCKDDVVTSAIYYGKCSDNYDRDGYPRKSASSPKSYSGGYSSGGKSGSKNSGNHTTGYDTYDEGYEDVWLNEDYDWDRYQEDDDYARGVDDAMEDLDEDW